MQKKSLNSMKTSGEFYIFDRDCFGKLVKTCRKLDDNFIKFLDVLMQGVNQDSLLKGIDNKSIQKLQPLFTCFSSVISS